jgi:Protein of unknown function (DUF1573)
MKKIVLLLAFTFLATTVTTAQEVAAAKKMVKKEVKKDVKKVVKASTPTVEGAGIVFDNETIDYGTIAHNADGTREFTFTNNGNKPLTITNTQGSCGCTVPTTPKEPIAPGAKGVIGVHYATDRVGAFTKTVTVTSNAVGAETKVLTIKGTVLGDEPAVSPLTPKS